MLFAATIMLMILVAGVATALVMIYQSDWIMPGVQAAGIELGGRSSASAMTTLEARGQAPTIQLETSFQSWSVPGVQLGIVLDAENTVHLAHQSGRDESRLWALLRGEGAGVTVTPQWRIDQNMAERFFGALAAQVEFLPSNARLELRDGQLQAIPATYGRTLDVEATVAYLTTNLARTIQDEQLSLVITPLEPAASDIGPAIEQAHAFLSHSVAIQAYDPVSDETINWQIPGETWATWLALQMDSDNPTNIQWLYDDGRAAIVLDEQPESLGADRFVKRDDLQPAVRQAIMEGSWQVNLRVYHHPRQHTVQHGETMASIGRAYGVPYPWIQQANPEVSDALHAGQSLTIPSPDLFLPLPVIPNKRIVISIDRQMLWAYEDGELVWEWVISTGIDSSPTSPGVFQVQTHEPDAYAANWDLWMPAFMGIYRPVPYSDFMNGFHGFPTRGGSQLLWTGNLGRPITYGCILVSTQNANLLFDWAVEGTVVEIRP